MNVILRLVKSILDFVKAIVDRKNGVNNDLIGNGGGHGCCGGGGGGRHGDRGGHGKGKHGRDEENSDVDDENREVGDATEE